MPVLDWVLNAIGVIENIISGSVVSLLTYMIVGGWQFVCRAVSYFIDIQLTKLIATVYGYFLTLLTGQMFEEALTDALLGNVYIFIGVLMFFRLMMVILRYLLNPDLIDDAKSGASAIIKRVILGACGMLFIPFIFDTLLSFQAAVLKDSLVQRLIIPADIFDEVSNEFSRGGNYIGTYVLAGFVSPNARASKTEVNEFKLGIKQGDLSNIDINDGGFLTQNFKYDYFFFVSTIALAYVFYYLLKYCLDLATRFFKLLLYQILAPVAMVEYMINGSQDGVFKNWLQATLSTYFLLFVRVLAIWFVVFVTLLMGDCSNPNYAGGLLKVDDYFLRAIIIIALIGFMMDLPKLVGQIFGVDLEQEGSATGVLKQMGGILKGAAIGGLAVGGAALGSMAGGLGKAAAVRRAAKADAKAAGLQGAELKNATRTNLKDSLKKMDKTAGLRTAGMGILGAAMGSNQFTGAFANSASNAKQQQQSVGDNPNEMARKKKEELDEKAAAKKQREEDVFRNVVERIIESSPKDTPMKDIMAKAMVQMFGEPSEVSAKVNGKLSAISASGQSIDLPTATQTVKQVLGEKFDASAEEVEQVIRQVVKDPGNISPSEIDQVVNQVIGSRVSASEETLTQVVNQTYGTRVNNSVDDATQKVTQQLEVISDNVDSIEQNVRITTDIEVNRDIREQQELGTFMPEDENKR